ncbi:MAG: DUF3304 domain-containing protein [Propionivibrio sp.]|jgi:hypothetical protein|nr:DUF3304 domain-containing protein [Propionivibrio sp.]MBP7525493.1 DUF3304 domain-containing protein [Propionivibrio sp.]MBP8162958.1 DUF3304 domain-containing protein [Propionivibrio sp.]
MRSRLGVLLAGLALALTLTACQEPKEPDNKEGVPVGITGINHTTTYIADFYIDGAFGGNISNINNGGGGGSTTCCVVIPHHYRPGLTAKVRWNHTESRIDNWKETVATVLPYPDGGGHAWVNFLPDDRVVIVLSDMDTWSRGYLGEHKAPSHPDYRGATAEFPSTEEQQ